MGVSIRAGSGAETLRRSRRALFSVVIPQISFVGLLVSTLWTSGGPWNSSISDAVLVGICLLLVAPVLLMLGMSSDVAAFAKPILMGSTGLALLGVGHLLLVGGSAETIVKDYFSWLYLVLGIVLLLPPLLSAYPVLVAFSVPVVGAALGVIVIAEGSQARATGTFANPNLTGAWLAMAALFTLTCRHPKTPWVRILLLAIMGLALYQTQSFAAIFGLLLGTAYVFAHRLRLSAVATVVVVGVCTATAPFVIRWLDSARGLSRSDRSLEGRLDRWQVGLTKWLDAPWGIGSGEFSAARSFRGSGTELHSEFVQALVEGGPLGVLLVIGLGIVLWTRGGLVTRSSLLCIAGMSVWRDTFNFRFMWLVLASSIAVDYWNCRRQWESKDISAATAVGDPIVPLTQSKSWAESSISIPAHAPRFRLGPHSLPENRGAGRIVRRT